MRAETVADMPEVIYPGGSKSRLTRAGQAVRNGCPTQDDLAVIDTWRAAHGAVLNTFQAILRNRVRGTGIVVAQRHKRKRTIFDKLRRFPRMELARMDDIAGCRLIFETISELRDFRTRFHKAKFKHNRTNGIDKYDYIAHPRETGYRGIHDIYEYDANSEQGKPFKGLFLEIQYRTLVQHAWATAVEVIGIITDHQPKFQRGDKRYERAMALASEVLARAYENSTSCFPNMTDEDIVLEFLNLDEEIELLSIMKEINASGAESLAKGNVILFFADQDQLKFETYRDAPGALRALFKHENEYPGADVVLVRADTSEDIKTAFRNYFTDATEFIGLVEEGCQKLSGRQVVGVPVSPSGRG